MDGSIMIVATISNVFDKIESKRKKLFGNSDICKILQSMSVDESIRYLSHMDITAVKIIKLSDVKDKYTKNSGKTYSFLQHTNHPIGCLTIVSPGAIRMNGIKLLKNAPKYGENTLEYLKKFNMTSLILTGEASVAWSRTYMPFSAKCDYCNVSNSIVELRCGHKYCHICLSSKLSKSCIICGETHETNVLKLSLIHI